MIICFFQDERVKVEKTLLEIALIRCFISVSTKTKQITLVFEWVKTKQIKINIFFRFITKTKQTRLVFKIIKTNYYHKVRIQTKFH